MLERLLDRFLASLERQQFQEHTVQPMLTICVIVLLCVFIWLVLKKK